MGIADYDNLLYLWHEAHPKTWVDMDDLIRMAAILKIDWSDLSKPPEDFMEYSYPTKDNLAIIPIKNNRNSKEFSTVEVDKSSEIFSDRSQEKAFQRFMKMLIANECYELYEEDAEIVAKKAGIQKFGFDLENFIRGKKLYVKDNIFFRIVSGEYEYAYEVELWFNNYDVVIPKDWLEFRTYNLLEIEWWD